MQFFEIVRMDKYAIILIIVLIAFYGCLKKEKNESVICERFQLMSERCEGEILSLIKSFINENKNNGQSDFDFVLIENRIKKKISQKQALKQCERYRLSKDSDDINRFKSLKSCLNSKSCNEFAGCIIIF